MSEATTGVPAAKASVRTMPKLSPPSDGAHSTSASASTASFSASLHLPCATTSRGSSMSGARPSSSTPTTCSVAGTCSRSASKARSRTGRPLRSTAWPMKAIRSGSSAVAADGARGAGGGDAGTSTPLGMIRYVPPKKRRPVQAAACETAMRTCSRFSRRRAPKKFARLLEKTFSE